MVTDESNEPDDGDDSDDPMARWYAAYAQDESDLSPEELCPDGSEEELEELAKRIENVKWTQRFRPATLRWEKGSRIPDTDFTLVERIGEGSHGQVWKARNKAGHHVALKFCHPEDFDTLKNESQKLDKIMSECEHWEGIVRLLDVFLDKAKWPYPFLAFEYVEGKTFADHLTTLFENNENQKPFSPAEAAEIIYDLAMIMASVHALKIAHRDLKPKNILIRQLGPPYGFKITDFGVGVIAESATATKVRQETDMARQWRCVGTLLYMSPEQLSEKHVGDPADDVYALGVLWYQLLVGKLDDRPSGTLWPKDKGLDKIMTPDQLEVLTSCFEAQGHRPETAGKLAEKIKKCFTLPRQTTKDDAEEVQRLREAGQDWVGYIREKAKTHMDYWNTGVNNRLPEALWLNGLCWENAISTPDHVPNLGKARNSFQLATEEHYANAQYELALYCKHGLGGAQNVLQAISLFDKAAKQGHREAMYVLGLCYLPPHQNL